MTRQVIASAWYGEQLPTGEWAATIPHVGVQSHLGSLGQPEPFGPLYLRCTAVNGFRCAGQAHDTVNPACWEWNGSEWQSYPQPCVGVNAVIYDLHGMLHRSDGSVGSQGYRYVTDQNVIISGDETYYNPITGLSEYTELGNGLSIGQGHDHGGVCVWDGSVLRLLEAGACTFVRATREGETVGVAFHSVEAGGVVLMLLLMSELFDLPPVVPPVDPPIPPVIPPVDPPPVIPPVKPPVIPPPVHSPIHTLTRYVMADTQQIHLIGPAGQFAYPDALNTGPWASAGWRGVKFKATADDSCLWELSFPDGTHAKIRPVSTGGMLGMDATKFATNVCQQWYVKASEDGWGGYEALNCYSGYANGTKQVQMDFDDQSGKYASAGLTIVVL